MLVLRTPGPAGTEWFDLTQARKGCRDAHLWHCVVQE